MSRFSKVGPETQSKVLFVFRKEATEMGAATFGRKKAQKTQKFIRQQQGSKHRKIPSCGGVAIGRGGFSFPEHWKNKTGFFQTLDKKHQPRMTK